MLRKVLFALSAALMLATLCIPADAGSRRIRWQPCTVASEPTPVAPSSCPQSAPVVVRSYSREVHTQTVRDCDGKTCRERTVTVNRTSTEAQRRAEDLARREQIGHFWAVTSYEGVGMGSTADQAQANCCYWGQRPARDIGVSQGASGRWYAVVHYD